MADVPTGSEPPPSPDAQYGTAVARASETGDVEDLSDEQRELVEEMKEQEAALLNKIFGKEMPAEKLSGKTILVFISAHGAGHNARLEKAFQRQA